MKEVASNLTRNGYRVFLAKDKSEASGIAISLIQEGSTVCAGGSETLAECKILEMLESSGKYNCVFRKDGMSNSQTDNVFATEKKADYFLCSSNAVTANGVLYNVDGRANRVSAISHGAKNIIMIVGKNKIVPSLEEAILRVKTIAAPKNTLRLSLNTFCRARGVCEKPNKIMTDGCSSDHRICCHYLVSAKQRIKDRITVILVDEVLGY